MRAPLPGDMAGPGPGVGGPGPGGRDEDQLPVEEASVRNGLAPDRKHLIRKPPQRPRLADSIPCPENSRPRRPSVISTDKYTLPARLLHWIMAVGFVFMWGCGYVMTTPVENDGPTEGLLTGLHISVGVTLVFLLALRVPVRLTNRPPALPNEIPELERMLAHLGHLALYGASALVLCLGWMQVDFGGHTVHWFGLAMPKVFPGFEAADALIEFLHKWGAYAMPALAAGHVAAAFKHRWIDGHDVIRRMTIGGREAG